MYFKLKNLKLEIQNNLSTGIQNSTFKINIITFGYGL